MIEIVLNVLKFFYGGISILDEIIRDINFSPLSSISGFVSLLIGSVIINLILIGIILFIVRLRK